jgi:hypothetical protein
MKVNKWLLGGTQDKLEARHKATNVTKKLLEQKKDLPSLHGAREVLRS